MMKFEDEMEALKGCMAGMADLTSSMVCAALSAVEDIGSVDSEMLSDEFAKVDRYDRRIEEASIRILTLYHPMASDMRMVATYLKCITYLERIAKYSKNIAVATKYLSDKPAYDTVELIRPMGDAAVRMVQLVTRCFEDRTVEGLDKVSEMDDYLDRTMREDLKAIVGFISENGASADVCTYYISVLKFLERVGDHACKMAEKITFMVTGERATIR